MLFGNINNQVAYNCFAAEDFVSKQSWTICDTDHDKVSELRETLILAVIKYGLSTFGIYGLEELMKFQKLACEDPKGWNYAYQSRWPCMCPEGMLQSPIDIPVIKTINSTAIRADFRKWDVAVTSYVQLLYPQENFAKGEFGTMMFKDQSRKKNFYSSTEIRFKSPAEHTVDGKVHPIEMQVVHTNGDSRSITSIFLTDERKDMSMSKTVFDKSNE